MAKLTAYQRVAVGIKQTDGSTAILENLKDIGYLLVHRKTKEKQWIFPVKSISVVMPTNLDDSVLRYPRESFLYVLIEFDDSDSELIQKIDCTKATPGYDAMYSTLEELFVE